MSEINATLKVTTDVLMQRSKDFEYRAEQAKIIENKMLELIDSSSNIWQGEARNAYVRQFHELRDDMEKIYKMIDEYRQDLAEICRNYETAENQNVQMAQRLSMDAIY